MNIHSSEKRYNWISLYCDALKWGIVNEVTQGDYQNIQDLGNLTNYLLNWWKHQLGDQTLQNRIIRKRSGGLNNSSLIDLELCYLYDLEAELWSPNFSHFIDWYKPEVPTPLEPFKFVLLFYIVERAQRLLLSHLRYLNYEERSISHKTIRDCGFTHLYDQERLATWIPFPFNLTSLTTRITHGQADLARHRTYTFIGNHHLVVGKNHYTEILESALRHSVSWARKLRPDLPRGSIHSYYFDALWRYSESYRYRTPIATDYLRKNAFYWGFNNRWIATVFITLVELWIFTCNSNFIRKVWDGYSRHSS